MDDAGKPKMPVMHLIWITDLQAEEEAAAVLQCAKGQAWLSQNIEELAVHYAIANIVPVHYGEVKAHKQQMADKIAKAVKERLTCEIQYWDLRAADLKEKEAAGKAQRKVEFNQCAAPCR